MLCPLFQGQPVPWAGSNGVLCRCEGLQWNSGNFWSSCIWATLGLSVTAFSLIRNCFRGSQDYLQDVAPKCQKSGQNSGIKASTLFDRCNTHSCHDTATILIFWITHAEASSKVTSSSRAEVGDDGPFMTYGWFQLHLSVLTGQHNINQQLTVPIQTPWFRQGNQQ